MPPQLIQFLYQEHHRKAVYTMTYKSSDFKPGDKVRLTIEGYVYGAATNGLSLTTDPTNGSGAHPNSTFSSAWPSYSSPMIPKVEMLEAAYVPQPGDVALWRAQTHLDIDTTVVFCQITPKHSGWYMSGYGTMISIPDVDHTSSRFQLMVRDGKPVPATSQHAPESRSDCPAGPERQAVLDNYAPKQGDVGIYKTASGASITVSYRRNDRYPNNTCGWYQANGVESKAAHRDPSFQLVLRDGILQEGVNV